MATTETKEVLEDRATKAIMTAVSSYYGNRGQASARNILNDLPKVSLSEVWKMFQADSVAYGGAVTILDRMLENGYQIRSRKTGKRMPKLEQALRNKDFDFFLREAALHFIIFQNAFVEFVTTSNGNVKEFFTIDPTRIEIHTDKNNDLKHYSLKPGSEGVVWTPEEVLHMKDVAVELTQWGEVSSKTIFQAIVTKVHIKKFMNWLFETNQFRGIHNFEEADVEEMRRSITLLKEGERDITKPIITEGKYKFEVQRELADLNVLNELLYKLDEEILNELQVPPIYAGLPDNSNRSNSDAQERAFNTTIKARQHILKLNLDKFLQRMKMYDAEFVWNPISAKVEREVIEVAQIMKDIGVKPIFIADFMRESGIPIQQGEIFEKPEPMMLGGPGQTGNDTLSPSRRPKPEGEANKKIGTGERGTTRPDQLVSRSTTYPYTYEVLEEPQA